MDKIKQLEDRVADLEIVVILLLRMRSENMHAAHYKIVESFIKKHTSIKKGLKEGTSNLWG